MSSTLPLINQFSQTTVQGRLDLEFAGSVISCAADAAVVTPLVPGQAVKLATTVGGVPKVIPLAANTDQSFGFVVSNLKDQAFAAGAAMEVAMFGTVMHMTAGGAITRGASVEVSNAAFKVITSGGTNPVVGFALGSAAADGDLLRVFIQAPFAQVNAALSGSAKVLTVVATQAQINAGKILIPGVAGQAITVTNYTARVNGAISATTSIELESTNGTPVAVSTILQAVLTNGAVLTPASASTTLGAGFGIALGAGDGLQIVNNGSAGTGGTNVTFTLSYIQQ